VAIVGAWRQIHYGNVRLSDGLWIGALSLFGAIAGAVVANALPQRTLEIGFGLLMLTVAFRLVRQVLRPPGSPPGQNGKRPVELD
jgi:uncharacterized membrane protein YfcA